MHADIMLIQNALCSQSEEFTNPKVANKHEAEVGRSATYQFSRVSFCHAVIMKLSFLTNHYTINIENPIAQQT